MDALKNWLDDGSGRVKFIVSAVPVFPDGKRDSEDKWSGHIKQRTELLEFIRRNAIRRVVFLSGDIHCSMSAELTSPQGGEGFKVLSVIS
ncbi:MAG: alkaline phosphatase D family protein, partial [Acidobacteriota bacterium]